MSGAGCIIWRVTVWCALACSACTYIQTAVYLSKLLSGSIDVAGHEASPHCAAPLHIDWPGRWAVMTTKDCCILDALALASLLQSVIPCPQQVRSMEVGKVVMSANQYCKFLQACFLTRGDLYVSWEKGRDVFDRLLIDGDPSINSGNWMWLSASSFFYQYFRVYSPITYGKKYDPEGKYVRHFLPALKVHSHMSSSPWLG